MEAPHLSIIVECHAGYRGEEEPRLLRLGERPITVVEVLDRWLSPEHRYFKLRGDDGGIYLLRHDEASGAWELTVYDSGSRAETRLSST